MSTGLWAALFTLVGYAGLYSATCMLFVGAMHLKQLKDEEKIGPFWWWSCSPWIAAALVLDLLFNVFIGTPLFLEWPKLWPEKELMFSSRVKRWHRMPVGESPGILLRYRKWMAGAWAKRLNEVHASHI